MNTQRRRAFTVPEMLCVVAIITLILSIMMPTFIRMKEINRRTICANNLHQLHVAYKTYAIEHGRHLPVTGHRTTGNTTSNEGYWVETKLADRLMKYYLNGHIEVYYCPSALGRGFKSYPYPNPGTAQWWWTDWQIAANFYADRVTGYGSACHLNPQMPNEFRVRRTTDNPTLALIYDANDQGPNTTFVPPWTWRVSHDDGKTGPEGANRANLGGDVQWVHRADMKPRWLLDGGWMIWW